jgi:hypothetical protein
VCGARCAQQQQRQRRQRQRQRQQQQQQQQQRRRQRQQQQQYLDLLKYTTYTHLDLSAVAVMSAIFGSICSLPSDMQPS